MSAMGAMNRAPSRQSRYLGEEARNRPAITSPSLVAVLNVGFKYDRIVQETGRGAGLVLTACHALRLARW